MLKERKKKKKHGGDTHIDVVCIDVVICAFQNDPCGIICRGRQRQAEVLRLREGERVCVCVCVWWGG